MDIPPPLTSAIRNGNCVAMVGAGFSAPVVPQWGDLLTNLADSGTLDESTSERVTSLIESGTGRDLEAAAQTLRDAMGENAFNAAMRDRLGDPPMNDVMHRRLELLRGIPFRAVLTTNFDGVMPGILPGRDAYLSVLRPRGHRWWDRRYWETGDGASVVKLHGSVDIPGEIIFTRRDYRRRLYSSAAYSTFLRALMSTTTVLYLGFSFNDAYLNELRSEVLALLDHRGGDRPVAYAVLPNASPAEIRYSMDHEGIHILSYSSSGGTDFTGFDGYLEELYRQTNPKFILGGLLNETRIIWIDRSDRSNEYGMRFLQEAAAAAGGGSEILHARSPDEGLELASVDGDLVITHWGHGFGPEGGSVGEYVLGEIHRRAIETPVIVFSSGGHADANKTAAMRLGATSYEYTWEGLFQEINRIFKPGLED
jgi:SIR2-like domain